jgi:hypothetical protein
MLTGKPRKRSAPVGKRKRDGNGSTPGAVESVAKQAGESTPQKGQENS